MPFGNGWAPKPPGWAQSRVGHLAHWPAHCQLISVLPTSAPCSLCPLDPVGRQCPRKCTGLSDAAEAPEAVTAEGPLCGNFCLHCHRLSQLLNIRQALLEGGGHSWVRNPALGFRSVTVRNVQTCRECL
uniref:Uncharacterized protein n=1 Tax=Myotis myotis TaxID=51298 RepID=A0A7J7VIB9_MYOMY|nr:hypothetical protein mMyoMyo1_008317 [Myotis myotis]